MKANLQLFGGRGGSSGLNTGGSNTQSWASAEVRDMVGDANLEEFDTGNHPNKYSEDDPRWGTEAGTYTVYRAGDLERESVVFTANNYAGSESYAEAYPSSSRSDINPERSAVNTYTVTVKNPYVSKDLGSTYQELFGTKPKLEPSSADIRKGVTTGDLWVKADERVSKRLQKMGYDAWTMTDPAPPAKREMNIFGSAKKTMVKTARKVPDRVKDRWSKDASSGGFDAHAFKGGKSTGLTIDGWFKTDEYKKGKAAGKWA